MPEIDSRYEEGDVVATDRGRGVVATGSAVYRAPDLEASDLENDAPVATDGDGPVTDTVSEAVDGLDGLPDGWDHGSVLKYWSSIGGSWEDCVDELRDDEAFDRERGEEQCSATKGRDVAPQRWRNRF